MIYYIDSLTGVIGNLMDNNYTFDRVYTSFQNLIAIPTSSFAQANVYDMNSNQIMTKIILSSNTSVSSCSFQTQQDIVIVNSNSNVWAYQISNGNQLIGFSS